MDYKEFGNDLKLMDYLFKPGVQCIQIILDIKLESTE